MQTYVRDTTAMGAVLQFVDTITSVWGFQLFTQHVSSTFCAVFFVVEQLET